MSEQMWREVWNAAMQFKVATLPPPLTLDALMEVAEKLGFEVTIKTYLMEDDSCRVKLYNYAGDELAEERNNEPQLALLNALHQAIS